jgi:hypothetical protein
MTATKLTNAQKNAAHGLVFDAPGVINGSGQVRFVGEWPTGNIAVKPANDREDFGPLTVSPTKAQPLLKAIADRFPGNGPARLPGNA